MISIRYYKENNKITILNNLFRNYFKYFKRKSSYLYYID